MDSRHDTDERRYLLVCKDAKRLVVERMKELNINSWGLEVFLGLRKTKISSWLAYQTTLFAKFKVNITVREIYIICDTLGIYVKTVAQTYFFIKLPLDCCTIDYRYTGKWKE